MLTGSERRPGVASRVKGRPAILKSLRLLLIRVHRFGTLRARSEQDKAWAARTLDALEGTLKVATTEREAVDRSSDAF
jgi:hypothetical protein